MRIDQLSQLGAKRQILGVFHTATPPTPQEEEALEALAREWEPQVHRQVVDVEHGMALEIFLEPDERTRAIKDLFRAQARERFALHLGMIRQRDAIVDRTTTVLQRFAGMPNTPETRRQIETTLAEQLKREREAFLDREIMREIAQPRQPMKAKWSPEMEQDLGAYREPSLSGTSRRYNQYPVGEPKSLPFRAIPDPHDPSRVAIQVTDPVAKAWLEEHAEYFGQVRASEAELMINGPAVPATPRDGPGLRRLSGHVKV